MRQVDSIVERMALGAGTGFLMACFYVVWVVVLRLGGGGRTLEELKISLGVLVGIYLLGGIVGGVVAGALFPLTKWLMGAALVGFLAVIPFFAAVAITLRPEGPVNRWIAVCLGSSMLGALVGIIARSKEKRRETEGV